MKQDIHQQIIDRILGLLEQGVIPWRSPYLAKVGVPCNFMSRKRYRGINAFLLSALRFTSPYFLTFLQAKELGGHVRKGERGFLVIKYGTYTREQQDDNSGAAEVPEVKRGYLKGYTVFHASQLEGIAFPEGTAVPERPRSGACAEAENIVAGMPRRPGISHGTAEAFYQRSADRVHMPERKLFTSDEAYFSTLFHELSHATGHQSRLARKSLLQSKGIESGGEARKVYAEEELVAEMSAAFLNAHAGIVEAEIESSVAYLRGWISALKTGDAKGWIIRAAAHAQRAANFILNVPDEAQA